MRALTSEELRAGKPNREAFLRLPRNPIYLVTDNLTSGFNVGTIFRLADAFLIERIFLCGTTPTPPRRTIAKTSMGVERCVPWQYSPTARQVVSDLKAAGTQIVAVEITEVSVSPRDASYRFPLALVVGDEMKGVGAGVLDLADTAVGVPMAGMGNSINVTTAVAIVLYAAVEALTTTDPRSAPSTLRRRRQAQGLSLRALAHRAGVHYTTLAAIESGRIPRAATWNKILDALESPSYFIKTGREESPAL